MTDLPERIHYGAVGRKIWRILKARPGALVLAAVLLAGAAASKLAGPVIIRRVIDVDIPSGSYPALVATLAVFLLNALLFLLFNYLLSVHLERMAQTALLSLKRRLFNRLLGMDVGYFNGVSVGAIAARIQSDVDAVHELFTATAVPAVRDIVVFLGTIGVMVWFSPRLALVALAVVPLAAGFIAVFLRKTAPHLLAARKLNSELSGYMAEKLNSADIAQSYNQEGAVAQRLGGISERKFKAQYHADFMGNSLFMTIMFLCNSAAMPLVLAAGGFWVLKGVLTVGVLAMFLLYIEQLMDPLILMSEHINVVQRSFAAAQRVFEVMQSKSEISAPSAPRYIGRMERALEFRDVWMRYSPRSPWVLRGLSFCVRRGRRCAIVGATGSGKTSVINLLFKFYLPQRGGVFIDGVDIGEIPRASLRALMGLVTQDIHLFPGTLMENLKLMDAGIPDSRVHGAIAAAGLSGFFGKHALEKPISEGGLDLSAGERQVISIVRAMVADPQILVMDEATAALDPHTERIVQTAADKLFSGRTCVVIAHKMRTISTADDIIVMADGGIKESGGHGELMAKDGVYARYYKLQTRPLSGGARP